MLRRMFSYLRGAEDEMLDFDRRYAHNPKRRPAQLFSAWLEQNRAVISRLRAPRPAAMAYFDRCFTTDSRLKTLQKEKKKGTKIVGTFCNLVPEELVYAAGAIPIRLCSGCNDAIRLGEEVFPRDACPLIKSSFGQAVAAEPFFSLCDAIVIPATCDGKKKLGEILDSYTQVWMMDLPQSKERTVSKQYWLSECRLLKQRLEGLTGNKIGRKQLKAALSLTGKRYDCIRRFLDLRKSRQISGCDSLIAVQASFFDDMGSWVKAMHALCDELEQAPKHKKGHLVRILFTGAPAIMPNMKVPLLIEHLEAVIAMDETCAGSQYMYDPVQVDEYTTGDMMEAISERCLLPSVCPCFIKSEDRIDRLLELIKEYRIDAVVYHTLRLCILFDAEAVRIRSVMEQEGIPFLHINTDYSQEDKGQLRTRIEAFVEILHSRR